MFSDKEHAYLRSQRLARIATASKEEMQPDVAPVGFDFDGTYFYVSGYALEKTLKYRNVRGNRKVSLVVDDLVSASPWKVRGIKVHGVADLTTRDGYAGLKTYIRSSRGESGVGASRSSERGSPRLSDAEDVEGAAPGGRRSRRSG